jgi:thiol-disulfide isomerase/thioredoxin
MMRLWNHLAATVTLGVFLCCGQCLARTWTDSTGKYKREGEFVKLADDQVDICCDDGKLVHIRMDKLSAGDQQYVRKATKSGDDSPFAVPFHEGGAVPKPQDSAVAKAPQRLTGAEVVAAGPETYAEAHHVTIETGKPMVVMVCTDWCMPCQMMKKAILPRVRQRGLLRKVSFAMVNPDHDSDLAEKLTDGGPIPQLVMFRKTADGWNRQKLVGGQSVESVETFINEGLAHDEAEKKAAGEIGDKNAIARYKHG